MTTISALLDTTARRHPDRTALTWGERDMRYHELSTAVDRLADRLATSVTAGQRVVVVAPNTPALVVGLFAIWRVGGVAVPINARSREFEVRRFLDDSGAAAAISVSSWRGYSFAQLLSQLLPDLPHLKRCLFVDADGRVDREIDAGSPQSNPSERPLPGSQIALILYTSGTTGLAKGALITHQSEITGACALGEVLREGADDVSVFIVPICHAFGLTCFLASIASGARAVLVEATFSLQPLLGALRHHAGTLLHGSPSLWVSLLKSHFGPLPTLRSGFVAGAPCPASVLVALDDAGLRILNLYGMTELGAVTSCRADDPGRVRHSTVGRALPDYSVRVVHEEVQVAGPGVTAGYYNRPELTAEAFDAGWFRTGDLGALDADENLTITGRAKDVIHVAGHSVYPAEVEGFLLTHPDVLQAAVVGVPHPIFGEAVQAFVVLRHRSSLTPSALLQFARPRIAGYKLPYAIRVLDELPVLPTGKPDRAALIRSLTLA